ncbi:MAG: hypothetical protein ACRD5Z_02325, partial [Bryobacteraceae bacterium]
WGHAASARNAFSMKRADIQTEPLSVFQINRRQPMNAHSAAIKQGLKAGIPESAKSISRLC